jgi:hypothetical protein
MEDQNSSQNNTQSGRIAPNPSGGRCRNVIFSPGNGGDWRQANRISAEPSAATAKIVARA